MGGEGNLILPSHRDGAASLLHMGLTLGGCRTLRVGAFAEPNEVSTKEKDVWDTWNWCHIGQLTRDLKDIKMSKGSAYISAPYCFEHGVRFEEGTRDEPI